MTSILLILYTIIIFILSGMYYDRNNESKLKQARIDSYRVGKKNGILIAHKTAMLAVFNLKKFNVSTHESPYHNGYVTHISTLINYDSEVP